MVKRDLRSAGGRLVLVSVMKRAQVQNCSMSHPKAGGLKPAATFVSLPLHFAAGQAPPLQGSCYGHNFLALPNEVIAKNTNRAATPAASAISQRATSRVQARKSALSQATARTANAAPITSWKSCLRARQRRRKPRCCGTSAVRNGGGHTNILAQNACGDAGRSGEKCAEIGAEGRIPGSCGALRHFGSCGFNTGAQALRGSG